MTPTEILHKIVETENEARAIYDEAVALQEGFDETVKARVDEIKEKYAAQEERDVAEAEMAAVSKADEEIEALKRKLETELAEGKARFESKREGYIDKMFRLAVNLDA